MRTISPNTGHPEVTVAENQHEYLTLVGAIVETKAGTVLLTRWTFTAEERRRIAAGEDVYLGHLTFGGPLQPLSAQVGPEGWKQG